MRCDVHVVAFAVTDGVEAVVEEAVVARETFDRISAAVVLLAAAVRRDDAAVGLDVCGHVSGAAPLSSGHDQLHATSTSTSDRPRLRTTLRLLTTGD